MDKMSEYLELDNLRKELSYVKYEELGLKYLIPLYNEVIGRMRKLEEK